MREQQVERSGGVVMTRKPKSAENTVAVVGSGQAGMAALTSVLVDIAYNTPDDAPPVNVVLVDTRDDARPKAIRRTRSTASA